LAFSPDGKALVSSGEDRTLIFWDLNDESWKAIACGVANRNLTPQEWKQYLGDEPYNKTCLGAPAPQ
jgi:WD40 repeat protein